MKKGLMKKGAILLSLAMVLSSAAVTVGDGKDASAAKTVKLAKSKITVKVKQTKKIIIKGVKKKQVKKLTVKSKKSKLAKAKASKKTAIKVTGKKEGSTKVTVRLKLKKKVGGKKAYKFTLKVIVKKGDPTPTAEPTATPTKLSTEIVTVDLSDATYYVGQNTGVSPLDASGTKVTPAEAVSGEAVSLQWYKATDAASGSAIAIAGATSNRYTPDTSKAGTYYYHYTANFTPVAKEDKYAGSTATSKVATIKVLEKVPITFDANGGTFKNADKAKKEVKWGEILGTTPSASDMTAPTTGTGNKDFLGWATKSDAASSDVNSGTKITKAATFYAVWGTRPPDTSSYTPPSAPTPQNVTITFNNDGLQCAATVSDGTLSYQWYSTSNGNTNLYATGESIPMIGVSDLVNSIVSVTVTNSINGYSSTSVSSPQYAFVVFDANGATGHISGNYIGNESNDTSITESIVFKSINSYLAIGDIPANAKTNDNSVEATEGWVPNGETTAVSTSTQITGPLSCVPKWTS